MVQTNEQHAAEYAQTIGPGRESIKSLADAWGWHPSRVRKLLLKQPGLTCNDSHVWRTGAVPKDSSLDAAMDDPDAFADALRQMMQDQLLWDSFQAYVNSEHVSLSFEKGSDVRKVVIDYMQPGFKHEPVPEDVPTLPDDLSACPFSTEGDGAAPSSECGDRPEFELELPFGAEEVEEW